MGEILRLWNTTITGDNTSAMIFITKKNYLLTRDIVIFDGIPSIFTISPFKPLKPCTTKACQHNASRSYILDMFSCVFVCVGVNSIEGLSIE